MMFGFINEPEIFFFIIIKNVEYIYYFNKTFYLPNKNIINLTSNIWSKA